MTLCVILKSMHVNNPLIVIGLLAWLIPSDFVKAVERTVFESFKLEQPRQRQLAPAVSGGGLDKQAHELAAYKGKLVVLHFWASFCLPCREELPQLQSLWQQRRAEGLVVLSVALDRGSPAMVRETADELKIGFPVIVENQRQIRRDYEIYAIPTSYIISRDGRIIGRVVGARDWLSKSAQHLISALLKE